MCHPVLAVVGLVAEKFTFLACRARADTPVLHQCLNATTASPLSCVQINVVTVTFLPARFGWTRCRALPVAPERQKVIA